MNERMKQCLDYFVLNWEGRVFENVPDDPGGATKWGVIQTRYDEFRRNKGLGQRSVKYATEQEIYEIYEKYYWNPMRCSLLPQKLDLVVFDTGVNMGPGQAVKFLQSLLGLTADGEIGPKTLEAISKIKMENLKTLCLNYIELRNKRYYRLANANPKLKKFLKGWLNRTSALRDKIERS